MNKRLKIGALGVVAVGAIYLGGVSYSGKQANAFLQQQLAVAEKQTANQGDFVVTSQEGFFSSHYRIDYTVAELPEGIGAWMETDTIPMDLTVKHGFLNATSRIVLAESNLLDKFKLYLEDDSEQPLVIDTKQSFNPLSQSVDVEAQLNTARFAGELEEGVTFVIGSAVLDFEQASRDFELVFSMEDSHMLSESGEMRVEGVSGEETGTLDTDILQDSVMTEEFDASVQVDRIFFDDSMQSAELAGLVMSMEQMLDEGRVLLSVGYGADTFTLKDADKMTVIESPNMSVTLDVDYQSVRDLAEVMQSMSTDTNEPELAFEQTQVMLDSLDRVTQEGIGFDINDLSFELEGEKAQGNADLTLAPFTASEMMMNPMQLLQYVTLSANVSVPVVLGEKLPEESQFQLQMFVDQGLLVQQDTDYLANLSVVDGKMLLNGNEVPLF